MPSFCIDCQDKPTLQLLQFFSQRQFFLLEYKLEDEGSGCACLTVTLTVNRVGLPSVHRQLIQHTLTARREYCFECSRRPLSPFLDRHVLLRATSFLIPPE
jgi:hypothetical protein